MSLTMIEVDNSHIVTSKPTISTPDKLVEKARNTIQNVMTSPIIARSKTPSNKSGNVDFTHASKSEEVDKDKRGGDLTELNLVHPSAPNILDDSDEKITVDIGLNILRQLERLLHDDNILPLSENIRLESVSYTHLTLPTICSV